MPPGAAWHVRHAEPRDRDGWRELWAAYLAFYRVDVPDAATAATWRRVLDPASPVFGLIAACEERLVGFCVCVVHEATWSVAPHCYLDDLFTAADMRGRGVGRGLIEAVVQRARDAGWHDVYWHTEAGNAVARRLYDRVAGPADGFVRYRVRA